MSRTPAFALLFLMACSEAHEEPGHEATGSTSVAVESSTAGAPADVATAFFEAASLGDEVALAQLLTAGAREALQQEGGFQLSPESLGTFHIGESNEQGSEARVAVRAELDGETQELELLLRRHKQDWLVYGLHIELGEGGSFTLDFEGMGTMFEALATEMATAFEEAFEESLADIERGGSEVEIQRAREAFEQIQPIDLERHQAAYQIDLSATDRPASELIEEIFAGTGVELKAGPHEARLQTAVSVDVSAVSRLQALELVLRPLDLHPVLPPQPSFEEGPPTISLASGARDWPLVFEGPFAISVASLEEHVPHGTGSLEIGISALGIAPAVLAFQTQMQEIVAVDAIEDATGRSLNSDEGTTFWSAPEVRAGLLTTSLSVDLKNLLRDVDRIAHVRGVVRIPLPVAIESLTWERSEKEQRTELGVLTAERYGQASDFRLTGDPDVLDQTQVRLSALDRNGAPLGTIYETSSAFDGVLTASLQNPEVPAGIDLKLCRVTQVAYPFTLQNVPLKHADQMPAALAPLEFDAPAPLAVEFLEFLEKGDQFPEVRLRLSNATNKDVKSATVRFRYRNAGGEELEDFPHTLNGAFGFQGHEALVGAGAAVEHQTVCFFVPEGTKQVDFVVERLEFFDASSWEAAD